MERVGGDLGRGVVCVFGSFSMVGGGFGGRFGCMSFVGICFGVWRLDGEGYWGERMRRIFYLVRLSGFFWFFGKSSYLEVSHGTNAIRSVIFLV